MAGALVRALVSTATDAERARVRVLRRTVPALPVPLHADPLLHRVLAARGVERAAELEFALVELPPPDTLPGIDAAVERLLAARARAERVLVVGDYDCDGATSTAVARLGLDALGFGEVAHVVPNRFRDGYGLSPAIVERAIARHAPALIVTVDNGVASVEGVERAREGGVDVVVTDHHLPPPTLPRAAAMVNPNLAGSVFPSGNLAGVGVIFYVLLALRAALARRGDPAAAFRLAELLDLVAIGTVADVVPLDRVNRILVEQGLRRIRAGRTRPGVLALLERAGRDPARLVSRDIGFALGPRLNAAGRVGDMSDGIACLLARTAAEAAPLAAALDAFNRERRAIERGMRAEAEARIAAAGLGDPVGTESAPCADASGVETDGRDGPPLGRFGLCLHEADWHEGVIGIVAGRLKDRLHRPVVAFAANGERALRGSARSVPGVHLRDLIESIARERPGLIERFGGHAMAAGLTLGREALPEFARAFDRAVGRAFGGRLPDREWWSDGALGPSERTLATARALERLMPWGQGCEPPQFDGVFEVRESRTVGSGHLKMTLAAVGEDGALETADALDAIAFGETRLFAPGTRLRLVYALDVNRWQGAESVQLLVRHVEPVADRPSAR